MNEGPVPPEMLPGIRDLIARLEGYNTYTAPGGDSRMSSDRYATNESLDVLAIMLLINDHDEQIKTLQEELTNNRASVGFLTLIVLLQVFAIVYLFASR